MLAKDKHNFEENVINVTAHSYHIVKPIFTWLIVAVRLNACCRHRAIIVQGDKHVIRQANLLVKEPKQTYSWFPICKQGVGRYWTGGKNN